MDLIFLETRAERAENGTATESDSFADYMTVFLGTFVFVASSQSL